MNEDCNLSSALIAGINSEGSAYYNAFYTCVFVVFMVFIVSTITGNVSQVDKLWSIIPFVYTWYAVCDSRTFLMASVATIWGIRLTYNFYRRGGYQWPPWKGEEDYRWELLRQGHLLKILTNSYAWMLFNFIFISLYQNFLLLLIATPSLVAYTMATDPDCVDAETGNSLNTLDYVAAILFLSFIMIESIADKQQYTFQTEKYRQINAGVNLEGEYKDGFCQSGLFSIVRKPNYAAEQSIWITFYLFSVSATGGQLFNWTMTGWVLLVLLFQGSGALTEKLTLMKYPKYKEYQKRVPLYVPNFISYWFKADNLNKEENQPLVTE
jgi:steroid 5-alpha reductase family enzyme